MSPTENSRLWIYAIASTTLDQNQVESFGIDKQPIQWIAVDSLQVAVSLDQGNTSTARGLEQAFLEYELAMRELCDSRDCLPIRFGTQLSLKQIQELIRNEGERFRKRLEEFSGCVEVLVRWAVPIQMLDQPSAEDVAAMPKSTITESGTSYLVRRRDQSRVMSAADRLASETGARLREHCPLAIRKVLSSARKLDAKSTFGAIQSSTQSDLSDISNFIVIEVALLVLKSEAEAIKRLSHSEQILGQAPTLISGPWPMYSFVGQ